MLCQDGAARVRLGDALRLKNSRLHGGQSPHTPARGERFCVVKSSEYTYFKWPAGGRAVKTETGGWMAYAIMRCKKLASAGSVASSLKHCYRERETPNADMARTPENEHHGAKSTDEAMGKLRELLPAKRRKDAVLVVEYLMTASPEWWKQATPQQQAEFFQQSKDWLAKKYGQDRIIVATIHRDETSPHLSAFVVPLTQDGRLSAKEFIGDRSQMSLDQTTYAKAVRHLDLERGIQGSKARHQSIRAHYAAIERGEQRIAPITPDELQPKVLEKGLIFSTVETQETTAERLNAKIRESVTSIAQNAATARFERSRAKEWQDTANAQRNTIDRLQDAYRGLTPDQVREVIDLAKKRQQENRQALALKRQILRERGADRGR